MNLEKKIAELDGFINQFITEHFPRKNINDIKPHLIQHIKNDNNVVTFSKVVSEETEFTIDEFIKKACAKYYKQVMDYKTSYFNEEDGKVSHEKLINTVLDSFYESINTHINAFLEENDSPQCLSSISEKIITANKNIKESLKNDENVKEHAKMFLDFSPYDIESLLLLEEFMEGFAKLAFFKILKEELKYLPKINQNIDITEAELSELLKRAEQLETRPIWKQNYKKEKEPVSLFSFLKILLENLKNLFSKQETSRQLFSTTHSSSLFKLTDSGSKESILDDLNSSASIKLKAS